MNFGGRQLAESFRTVRRNTILIAQDIPAEQYGYKATPDVRSVGEMLAHIAANTLWPMKAHRDDRVSHIDFEMFMAYVALANDRAAKLTSKDEIVAALTADGEDFAAWLDSLDRATLHEVVSFPPPLQPQSKTRLEMLLGVKEHEMHHRAQLMLIQRLLGIVPHLTRNRQAAAR